MTKFADQLFDDLMREHGSTLAHARPPATRRAVWARRPVLAAGAGGLAAVAATAGVLVASGGTPAYAVTKNPDGTVTVAVYQRSGFAGANAKLRQLGDGRVVVVPVRPGCPMPQPPAVSGKGRFTSLGITKSGGGSVIVKARGIPAGDILVVGIETEGSTTQAGALLTSPPPPSCISLGAPPSG
jgi:hypothetical protein